MLEGIQLVDELELENQRVFVRVDYNVPFDKKTGAITDDERIRASLRTVKYAVDQGAKVILASHLGRPKGKSVPALSLEPCGARLSEITGWEVILPDDCLGDGAKKAIDDVRPGQVVLLENLRFHAEEEQDDDAFARELMAMADCYVGEAFGAVHRAHASVHALPRLMNKKAMGFLVRDEIACLGRVVRSPEAPFVAVLGGAKVADKIGIIEALLDRCDAICIGGAMANTLLAARGYDMHRSKLEKDWLAPGRTLLEKADAKGVDVLLPTDVVVAKDTDASEGRVVKASSVPDEHMALDIGPETVDRFGQRVASAKTLFWNGPMGLFENAPFAEGTNGLARAVAASKAFAVVGGGDSAAAIRDLGEELSQSIDHISTGGGASLELIEGKKLPGIEALRRAG